MERNILKRYMVAASQKFTVLMAATAISVCSSCSDDDGPAPLRPTLPAADSKPLRSVSHMGDVVSTYDWKFYYEGGRLVSADGVVRDPNADVDKTYSYTSRLSYGPFSVNVSNTSGEKVKVSLNASGYIEKMEVNRNIYEFRYMDGRLCGWNSTIFEDSFGHVSQYRSSATIEYMNGDLSRIVYTGPDDRPMTLSFAPSELFNRNGLLPVAVTKEMGCLGFEHLYYAGLLGRPTIHLVQRVTYSGPDTDYTINFLYSSTQDGNTVLCNYNTPKGGTASVNYAY